RLRPIGIVPPLRIHEPACVGWYDRAVFSSWFSPASRTRGVTISRESRCLLRNRFVDAWRIDAGAGVTRLAELVATLARLSSRCDMRRLVRERHTRCADGNRRPVRSRAEVSSMTQDRVVKHLAAPLGGLGLALGVWMMCAVVFVTPAAAQACVGTAAPPAGKVCGLAIDAPANPGRALYSYRGIPYALPPIGALRWAPPQPYPRWDRLRSATSFGAVCPQDGVTTGDSEDCLFL